MSYDINKYISQYHWTSSGLAIRDRDHIRMRARALQSIHEVAISRAKKELEGLERKSTLRTLRRLYNHLVNGFRRNKKGLRKNQSLYSRYAGKKLTYKSEFLGVLEGKFTDYNSFAVKFEASDGRLMNIYGNKESRIEVVE